MNKPHHVEPLKTYYIIFAILMVLLVLTVAASRIPFEEWHIGWANIAIATFIAVVKALLVILYFMHVKQGTKLTWIFSGAAFLWLGIMFALTLNDYTTREWTAPAAGGGANPPLEHVTVPAG